MKNETHNKKSEFQNSSSSIHNSSLSPHISSSSFQNSSFNPHNSKNSLSSSPRFDIKERTFQYSLQAIQVYQQLQLQKDGAGWIIGKQFLRSATSIGANVQEAQSGESKADFIHKFSIAQKEARETLYWLNLLDAAGITEKGNLSSLMKETDEIIAIITKIIVNTKKGLRK